MADRYWVNTSGGFWGDTSSWSDTSGGTPGASVPTGSDNVYIDANSFSTDSKLIKCYSPIGNCKNINVQPDINSLSFVGTLNVYGSAIISSGAYMTALTISFRGDSAETLESHMLDRIGTLYIIKGSGAVQLASDVVIKDATIYNGELELNGYEITADTLIVSSSGPGVLDAQNSTITIHKQLKLYASAQCSFGGSTINMALIESWIPEDRIYETELYGGGHTFHNVKVIGAITIWDSSTFDNVEIDKTIILTESNTFADLKLSPGSILTATAATTQTITSLSGDGTKEKPITLKSNSVGAPFIISKSSGSVSVNRYVIQDCVATGAEFTAVNSKSVGITTGWNITVPQTKITYQEFTYDSKHIVDGKCNTQHALTGESLAYDTLDFTVWSETDIIFVQGDPVDLTFEEQLINKFYILDVKRIGKELYQFSCVSAVGLLDMSMHYGDIYNGTLLTDVLAEILDGIDYDVDPLVSGIRLYGWLPYDTKRNNLQQITIATALSLKVDSTGTLVIGSMSADAIGTFGKDRCSLSGRVDKLTACTAVQVTEHYYSQSTETIVLFDDTFSTEEVILFPEPVHDLIITGGTIISSSANHAVVQGAGAVYLTGEKYIHNTRLITEGTIVGDATDHIISVSNSTLVTYLNSYSVAERIFAAYSYPSEIKTDVLFGAERSGDVVDIVNPYTDEVETAFARRMDIQFGSFLKASADFLIDYAPEGAVVNYQNRVLLDTDQTWVVPAGVEAIRVVLCGGGDGGTAGTSGTAGQVGSAPYYSGGVKPPDYARGEGGKGGTAGALGEGGKVLYTDEIVVTEGQEFAVLIGAAGVGGATEGAAGSAGGDTTFGAYTSADGTKRTHGFTDIGSGNLLGVYGKEGIGAADGKGEESPFNGRAGDMTGLDSTLYIGGEPGKVHDGTFAYAYGGGGSGATGNSNGGKGVNGSGDNYRSYGGAGAAGIKGKDGDNATLYGGGGDAGNGGSGGGGGGSAAGPYGNVNIPGAGGAAGTFGKGGNGKAGCVIIYY